MAISLLLLRIIAILRRFGKYSHGEWIAWRICSP